MLIAWQSLRLDKYTFLQFSLDWEVQSSQFKACWIRDFEDIKLEGKMTLRRGLEWSAGRSLNINGLNYGYFVL